MRLVLFAKHRLEGPPRPVYVNPDHVTYIEPTHDGTYIVAGNVGFTVDGTVVDVRNALERAELVVLE